MKKIKEWLQDIFSPEDFNDLNIVSIGEAFNDPGVRKRWLLDLFEEIKRINMDLDRRLLVGTEFGLTDLCARRKAIQDVLELVLSARRAVVQEERPNPRVQVSGVNLDRVTA